MAKEQKAAKRAQTNEMAAAKAASARKSTAYRDERAPSPVLAFNPCSYRCLSLESTSMLGCPSGVNPAWA